MEFPVFFLTLNALLWLFFCVLRIFGGVEEMEKSLGKNEDTRAIRNDGGGRKNFNCVSFLWGEIRGDKEGERTLHSMR